MWDKFWIASAQGAPSILVVLALHVDLLGQGQNTMDQTVDT